MADTDAELITAKHAHPYRKAIKSPNIKRKYTYRPPVRGNIAPISAKIKAPNKENIPAMTQTRASQTGQPTCAAITAGFIKMPEPMMLPVTTAVAAQKPIVWRIVGVAGIIVSGLLP
jgi:hypothetical protein